MLPDRFLQLLTAFVDGEASARERKHVERLLRKSAQARTVLQLLQKDSHGVRDLTRRKLGPDFPSKVMRTIGRSEIRPRGQLRHAPAPPSWIGMPLAASVLVLIGAASYWYFAPRQDVRVEGPQLVRQHPNSPAKLGIEGAFGRFGQSAIRLDALAFAAETTPTRLSKELRQENAYHVDLAVRDNSRAVQRLSAALRGSGVKVVMAASTQKSLTQKQGKMSYLFVADNLSPEELAAILHQLGSRTKDREDAGVQHAVVDVMTPEHRQRLLDTLGTGAGKGPNDPPAELLNKKFIASNSKGQGGQPMASETQASPAPERYAFVLALPHGALTRPSDSPELRNFLSRRREQRPGTLQVLLVVHEASV